MSSFNIDIEKYYQEVAEANGQLLGMFCLQYPIYCIHAKIHDETVEPLDHLDRVIAQFIDIKTELNAFQIAGIIGTSPTIVKNRIIILESDGLIKHRDNSYSLTPLGRQVFKEKELLRLHVRSYDFYIDGITLQPLPSIFYHHYRYKFISEYDTYIRSAAGKELIDSPFGPDIVHTPPDRDEIARALLSIPREERSEYGIPVGLNTIEEISFTKLSLHILVSAINSEGTIVKQVIDAFGLYAISENLSYTESLRKNVVQFETTIQDKINKLEFRLLTLPSDRENDRAPILTSNWSDISNNKYELSAQRCFSFAKEDLVAAIRSIYGIKSLPPDSINSTDTRLEISISKKILLESSNRHKLIKDLLRKRDYKFGKLHHNVFLLYLHYKTDDFYVQEVMRAKELIEAARVHNEINSDWLKANIAISSIPLRELLVVSGELDLLEKMDIEQYMIQLN